jgi:hypothetical protein
MLQEILEENCGSLLSPSLSSVKFPIRWAKGSFKRTKGTTFWHKELGKKAKK